MCDRMGFSMVAQTPAFGGSADACKWLMQFAYMAVLIVQSSACLEGICICNVMVS
jgi:hypothetical protein